MLFPKAGMVAPQRGYGPVFVTQPAPGFPPGTKIKDTAFDPKTDFDVFKQSDQFQRVVDEFIAGSVNLIGFAHGNMREDYLKIKSELTNFAVMIGRANFDPAQSCLIYSHGKRMFDEFCALMSDDKIQLPDRKKALKDLSCRLSCCGSAVIYGIQKAVFDLKSPEDVFASQVFQKRQALIDTTLERLVQDQFKDLDSTNSNKQCVNELKDRLGFFVATYPGLAPVRAKGFHHITPDLLVAAEQSIQKNVGDCQISISMAKDILKKLNEDIRTPFTKRQLESKLNQLSEVYGVFPLNAVANEQSGSLSIVESPYLLAKCLLQKLTGNGLCPEHVPTKILEWAASTNTSRSIFVHGESIPYVEQCDYNVINASQLTPDDIEQLKFALKEGTIAKQSVQIAQDLVSLAEASATRAHEPIPDDGPKHRSSAPEVTTDAEKLKQLLENFSRQGGDLKGILGPLQAKTDTGQTALTLSVQLKEYQITEKLLGVIQKLNLPSDQKMEILQAKDDTGKSILEMALASEDINTVNAILNALPTLGLDPQQTHDFLCVSKVLRQERDSVPWDGIKNYLAVALRVSLQSGNTQDIQLILTAIPDILLGPNPTEIFDILQNTDKAGRTGLFLAVQEKQFLAVQALLESLPQFNLDSDQLQKVIQALAKNGFSALGMALMNADSDTVMLILNTLPKLKLNSEHIEKIFNAAGIGKLQDIMLFIDGKVISSTDQLLIHLNALNLGPEKLLHLMHAGLILANQEKSILCLNKFLEVLPRLALSPKGVVPALMKVTLLAALKEGYPLGVESVLRALPELKLEPAKASDFLREGLSMAIETRNKVGLETFLNESIHMLPDDPGKKQEFLQAGLKISANEEISRVLSAKLESLNPSK
ncbi:MAG: hypothetical protein QM527_03395 [Alphaproteobacteria bacterium]|nr:hypothetical protein [Alphaproteobacteria bacterium]